MMTNYGTRVCVICGNKFYGYVLRKYCGAECQKVANREYDRRGKEKEKARRNAAELKKKEEQNKGKTLVDIAAKAKEAGMSYGKYEAMMELERRAKEPRMSHGKCKTAVSR